MTFDANADLWLALHYVQLGVEDASPLFGQLGAIELEEDRRHKCLTDRFARGLIRLTRRSGSLLARSTLGGRGGELRRVAPRTICVGR